jgi:integrase
MLILGVAGGLRVSELVGLRLKDVEFNGPYVYILVRGKGRRVLLSSRVSFRVASSEWISYSLEMGTDRISRLPALSDAGLRLRNPCHDNNVARQSIPRSRRMDLSEVVTAR